MIDKLERFKQTKTGSAAFGLLSLALAYVLASLAIARGNLWYYLLTLIFLVAALQNFFRLIKLIVRR